MVDAVNFEKLFMDEQTADVHFLFQASSNESTENTKNPPKTDAFSLFSERVAAHKIILSAASTVFEVMFYGSLKEGNTVEIKDVSPGAFKQFLQFFYLTQPTITLEYVGEVLYLADKYDLPKCTERCFVYMTKRINGIQVMSVYEPAIRFNNQNVMQKCERVIVSNASKVLSSDEFLRSSETALKHIIAIRTLSAQQKFKAVMKWSRNRCLLDNQDADDMQNRRNAMGECFNLIDFNSMKRAHLLECIDMYKALFTFDEICELLKKVLEKSIQQSKVIFGSVGVEF